jgi:parallel beta-helix repeat protein
MRNRFSSFFLMVLIAPAAFALNGRSAVSVNGLDTNACTVLSPCRSFSAAISNTSVGGEVIALDSAGYGPFTVTNTLTVSGAPGVHAAITASGAVAGILVNASATDRVTIRNLVLIGGGAFFGIEQLLAGELRIIGCLVRNFSNSGIEVRSGGIAVDHTITIDNQGGSAGKGIDLVPSGPDSVRATITNSLIQGNDIGILINSASTAVVSNCTISDNSVVGAEAVSTVGIGSVHASLTLENCTIAFGNLGVAAIAGGGDNTAAVFLSQNVISNNVTGATAGGTGTLNTFGNNRFTDNGSNGGPFVPIAFI